MSPLSSRLIFPIGLLLLGHSVYLALCLREQLQQHHHGPDGTGGSTSAYFPQMAVSGVGNSSKFTASTIPIFVELLVGIVVAIVGHVRQSHFQKARLVDKNCFERYDDMTFTGVDFMHFNHRGATLSGKGGNNNRSATDSVEAKKKS